MPDDDDDDGHNLDAPYERAGPTFYAFCHVCKWATGNYTTPEEPLRRARGHAQRQRHTTEIHRTTGVVVRYRGGLI